MSKRWQTCLVALGLACSAMADPAVADDDLFQKNSDHAYAEAWALTFFLTETEPQKYKQFLQKTATREPFTNYRSVERQKDFAGIFGKDLRMLNARLERFIKTLP